MNLGLSPAVVRSLVGIVLLVLGAVTAIALLLPGQGALTDGWRNISVPYFGTGRWALPAVLLLGGWYLEWGPGKEPGAPWGRTLLGMGIAYAGFLGAFQVLATRGGGRIGRFLADLLQPALTTPGAFIILLAIGIAGLLIALDRPLRSLLSPATRAANAAASTLQDRTTRPAEPVSAGAGRNGEPLTAAAGRCPPTASVAAPRVAPRPRCPGRPASGARAATRGSPPRRRRSGPPPRRSRRSASRGAAAVVGAAVATNGNGNGHRHRRVTPGPREGPAATPRT